MDLEDPLETDRDLLCYVCNLEYKDPRFLPCHHYYCSRCIDQLVNFSRLFACPLCGADTTIAEGSGADTLPKATVVHKIKKHVEAVKVLEAVSLGDPAVPYVYTCREHDVQQRLYCYDCNRLICSECTLTNHGGHRYEFVKEAAPKFRRGIESEAGEIASSIEALRATGEQLNQHKHEVLDQAEQAKVQVHRAFDEIQRILDVRREALVRAVGELTEYHVTLLDDKAASTRAFAASLEQLVVLMGKFAATSDEEFASSYQHLHSLLQAKKSGNQVIFNIEPAGVVVDITCVDDVRRILETHAKVLGPSLVAQNVGTIEFGKSTPFVIHHMALTTNKMASFKANLTSLSDQAVTPARVLKREKGTGCEVVCNPKGRGRHQLAIEVAGNPISGSPFPVYVTMPFAMLDKPVRTIKPLVRPTAVAVDSAGQVIVSERDINKVSIRDKKGLKRTELKGHPFQHPWGLAVDKEDSVYVTEYLAHRVTKFDSCGKFLKTAGKQGSGNLEFYYPKGIHITLNKLYVCDGKNDRIQVLDKELHFLEILSHSAIKSPVDVTSSPSSSPSDGHLFIIGSTPGIHVFSLADHTHLCSVEHKDMTQLNGISYSPAQSALYVSDASPSGLGVHIFQCGNKGKPRPELLGSFCQKKKGSGSLGIPAGIGLDEDCYVYVCDSEHDRILVF